MIKSRDYMENLLAELQNRQKKANEEYGKCPEGSLVQVMRGEKKTYFQVIHLKNGRIRKSISRNEEMICALARKKYLESELKIIGRNIYLLEKLMHGYIESSAANIIERLPDRYKTLPESCFFFEPHSTDAVKDAENNEIAWKNLTYEQSSYKPWEKEHITERGLRVRSKSEVIVAEKLDAAGIQYRYEQMLYIRQYRFAPDFTILTGEGIKYWEHCGRVNDKEYMRKHNWKLSVYETVGIVPWKNLIVTYDDENGGLDTRVIRSEIENKLLHSRPKITC